MTDRIVVRRGSYHDSAFLMQISRKLRNLPGIVEAVVLMGTDMNLSLLADVGFDLTEAGRITPVDLVVALRAEQPPTMDGAEQALVGLLSGGTATVERTGVEIGSIREALLDDPSIRIVSIAVPGVYAAWMAERALDAGRHVFLFSDNVAVEDEVRLKRRAASLGLLVMGPDCGTSILSGVGFGFANRVRRGAIGIVGPSGTGIQEVSCLVDRLGEGVSHAIGTGGRDMSAAVGGVMTEMALRLLADDEGTRLIVLVAKHPSDEVASRMHEVLADLGKPVVVRYLAAPPPPSKDGVLYVGDLDAAAAMATALLRGESGRARSDDLEVTETRPPGRLVGLFGGGSLAGEAKEILRRHDVHALCPDPAPMPGQPLPSGHIVVDTGDDVYTRGRPHPMVDQAMRLDLLRTAGLDPSVGVLLMDLVLGDGAHADPAPEFVPVLAAIREARGGDAPMVIVSVSGTSIDPQGVDRQSGILARAGVHVHTSAARAARHAARLLSSPRLP